MIQVYAPYTEWEDYRNGMYCLEAKHNQEQLISNGVLMLSDVNLFYGTCKDILKAWPVASAVNLSNRHTNRKSWLGQAACCYAYGVPETLTRLSWWRLTHAQRVAANAVAEKIIKHFELTHGRQDKAICF